MSSGLLSTGACCVSFSQAHSCWGGGEESSQKESAAQTADQGTDTGHQLHGCCCLTSTAPQRG